MLQLLLPLEDRRAERPVRRQLAVLELQVRHRRRVVPVVEPPHDGLGLVREPVRRDVGVAHHLLEDRADEVGRRVGIVQRRRQQQAPGGERGGLHEGLHHLPHLPREVRPPAAAHLRAPQADVRQLVGLHERPVPRGGVEDGVQLPSLHRVLHHLRDPLWRPPRQEPQDDDAERVHVGPRRELARGQELRVHVREGPLWGGRPVELCGDGPGGGGRHGRVRLAQEPADAEVPQLADQVGVQEDVARLQVAVDHRVWLVRVEEDQGRAHLADDLGAHLPCQWRRVVDAREPVLEAAVGEEFVNQAERLPAGADQCDEVWMPHYAEDSNLQWCHARVRHGCLLDCMK